MRIDAGEALRRGWAQGNVACHHPELVEEHDDAGESTGNLICTTCGEYKPGGGDNPQ